MTEAGVGYPDSICVCVCACGVKRERRGGYSEPFLWLGRWCMPWLESVRERVLRRAPFRLSREKEGGGGGLPPQEAGRRSHASRERYAAGWPVSNLCSTQPTSGNKGTKHTDKGPWLRSRGGGATATLAGPNGSVCRLAYALMLELPSLMSCISTGLARGGEAGPVPVPPLLRWWWWWHCEEPTETHALGAG